MATTTLLALLSPIISPSCFFCANTVVNFHPAAPTRRNGHWKPCPNLLHSSPSSCVIFLAHSPILQSTIADGTRQPTQGMGMTGTLGTISSTRPSHQFRPSQPSLRPQASSSSPSPAVQNFQGHGMLRVSSLGSPGSSSSPSSSQGQQSQTQPWLSSGTQGKPPLPTPSLRPQTTPQSFQQRSHITQHNMPTTSQKQTIGSNQQSSQPSASGQPQEHFNSQIPASRIQQSISHQQQITRGSGLGTQRPTLGMTQNKTASADTDEFSNRIVSKRSIQELVNQVKKSLSYCAFCLVMWIVLDMLDIWKATLAKAEMAEIDPSEKLDPEVEDILVNIAEDFVESITTFGCSLARHRKSTTLEAKDIILHLETGTWLFLGLVEMRLRFSKNQLSEMHRERLAAVKKSILVTDMMSKTSTGLSGANAKSHLAKGPVGNIGTMVVTAACQVAAPPDRLDA
ncbi:hypothetical protein OROGR_023917 [Orobanche gracilis]